MPNTHAVELVGQEVVADTLGVTTQCVSMWYKREAADVAAGKPAWGMPKPTLIEYKPGKPPAKVWRRQQLPVWEKWLARRAENRKDRAAA